MQHRKAQSAGGSAILVAIITTLIILYILFIPPEERARLLGEDVPGDGTGTGGPMPNAAVLFDEVPGTLSLSKTTTIEHTIPSIRIQAQTDSREIKRIESLTVRKGSFEEEFKEVKFRLETELSSNLLLSFTAKKASGELTILLNNQEIYSKALKSGTAEILTLPGDYLVPDNVLTFQVSSPGGAFWRVNEYQLENIVISGDVTDISRAFSEVHFSMSDSEFENLDKAELRYTPQCDSQTAGSLAVLLNTKVLFGGVPTCKSQNKVEVAKNLLTLGDNVLAFQTGGKYQINNIKLVSTLKKPTDPIYYFDIPPEYYQYVHDRELDGYLLLSFPDEGPIKQGVITLNSHKQSFKTQGAGYTLRVSPYLKDGSNALMISPTSSSLTITELRVELK